MIAVNEPLPAGRMILFKTFLTDGQTLASSMLTCDVMNKAGYTATPVACGWAGAIIEISGAFGREQ